jgi:hypothetical protein
MPLTPLHHSIAMASKSGCAAVCAARKRALGPSMYWEERQLRARHLAQVPLVAGEARRRRELDGIDGGCELDGMQRDRAEALGRRPEVGCVTLIRV